MIENNLPQIRDGVRALCAQFSDEYWRELDAQNGYPTEFVQALTDAEYLGVLIPQAYGGSGLGIEVAGVILEEICKSGGHPGICHAQMYTMGTLLRHGTDAQKQRYLPGIADGSVRLQAFGVTEPEAGTDTTRIQTFAEKRGDHYIVNGEKIWTSRVAYSDLMILLARTTPRELAEKRTRGMSVFLVDLHDADGLTIEPIESMINRHSARLTFSDLKIPLENLIGEEGRGFHAIIDGMNAERILLSYECIGDAHWFVRKAIDYANKREVFGRPIGQNQGVQFPLARAYAQNEAAALIVERAAKAFDGGEPCGPDANMALLLSSEAAWEAAEACLQTHGGYGFAKAYDVERKYRETRLYRIAPLSTNLILSYIAEHVLGLPRSY